MDLKSAIDRRVRTVENIKTKGISFTYYNKDEKNAFSVGPIDLEARCGEILFIIGANGSGKTTLAKLLTGLYEPDSGEFFINDKSVRPNELSEYFSVVFSPAYIFEKLYSINLNGRAQELEQYLTLFNLEKKINISDNKYSTINLSGGQRKRLALMQCYFEDSPIYLFDEWAADQDPGYRNFFYRTLLPQMKEMGKIVIAITHDDHYFDVADKILKMDHGKLVMHSGEYIFSKA